MTDKNLSLLKIQAILKRLFTEAQSQHWYVKGKQFFELHELYEEVYKEALEQEDALAEAMLFAQINPLKSVYINLHEELGVDFEPLEKIDFVHSVARVQFLMKYLIKTIKELFDHTDVENYFGSYLLDDTLKQIVYYYEKCLYKLNRFEWNIN